MDPHVMGVTAALMTSLMWTVCSIFFASAGKRIGSLSVNAIRILMAIPLLVATHVILLGTLQIEANIHQWFWLSLGGVIGLALGDFGYFAVLVILGPRRSSLLMAMAPIFTVITGYFWLGETLGPWVIVGITLTLTGVFIAIIERQPDGNGFRKHTRKEKLGYALGIIGSIGQGVGVVISKYGMINVANDPDVPLNSLSATLIRMIAATLFIWFVVVLWGKLGTVRKALEDRRAVQLTTGGAISGPFLGVWFSMIAVTYTLVGVASTLMSVMPIMIIPAVWFLYREKTSWRGVLGAVIAVIGVAILFLN